MNENLPNGIPGQHDPMKPTDRFVPFNGIESSHSSRDSSPGLRTQIPLSQLPPSKMEIPAGQLPPKISNITGQMGRISLTKPSEQQTPFSSPNIYTSTPILEAAPTTKSNLISPIGTPKPKEGFTHSSTSQFASVKNVDKKEIGKEEGEKKVSSFFTKSGVNGSLKDLRNMDDFNHVKNQQNEQKMIPTNVVQSNQNFSIQNVPQPIKMASQPNLIGNQGFTHQQNQQNVNQSNLQGNPSHTVQNQQVNTQQNVQQMIKMGSQPNLMSSQSNLMSSQQSLTSQPNLMSSQPNLMSSQQNLMSSQSNLMSSQQNLTSQPNLTSSQQNIMGSQQNIVSSQQNTMNSQPNLISTQANLISSHSNLMGSQQNLMGNQGFQHQQNQPINTQNIPQPIKINQPNPNVTDNQQFGLTQKFPGNQPSPNQAQQFGMMQNQPNPMQQQHFHQQMKMNRPNLSSQSIPNQQYGAQQPPNQLGFPINQQQKPPIMPQTQQPKSFSPQNPQIQPHLQQHQQQQQQQSNFQGSYQQARMPPPKSNSFPQMGQNLPSIPVNSDQNKAHLHANRYPQNNFNVNQNQPQQQQIGYQNQPVSSFQNQPSSSFQNQPPSSFQNQPPSNFQTQPPSSFQNQQQTGFKNQPQSGFQNQPQSGFQNQPQSGFQNQPQSGLQNSSYQQNYQQTQYQNRVTQSGFNKLWGNESYDLLQCPNILPPGKVEPPKINLGQEFLNAANCNGDIFRCTMTKIPESTTLLQKSRLPLGVLIHPFKDLSNLPVIQCNTIVRCRTCRTYINPFVFFVDSKRWKCNLCYRVNELPEEFQYDPVSKTYGDPSRRPEVRSSTIEYIAPAEYMLRPPQPAIYLYLFDVSRLAVETGYLHTVCNVLSAEIKNIPGDARTQIGFLCYDSCLHFYSLAEGQNQPHEMTVLDIDDIFIPCPDNLLVNLQDRMDLIMDLLSQLPTRFSNTFDTNSALGAALQAAHKMTSPTGGRITVFQTILPNKGPGSVVSREDPNQRSSNEVHHLNPANDFYKRLALECSGQQIAVDLFILNSQYVDLATISGISRFSGGCIYHFPLFKASRTIQNDHFERSFRRYVTRKIGFEAVMRIRCTRGLSIHTFHGNFFVRSTDLLSLPNINPDAGFGMQVSIEENLSDVQTICFQAALLYTSSKGERRIRVHTLCLPIGNTLHDIMNSADQQCIVGLLAKMAVDRSMQSSLLDAREAFLNVAIDILTSYKIQLNMGSSTSGLMAPNNLRLLPLYISALLKSIAFRVGTSTRLDDRVRAMCDMKTKPLPYLIQQIYPDLYPVHNLEEHGTVLNEEEEQIHLPPHLQLTARNLDSNGAYLMDMGEHILLFICANISQVFLKDVLDCNDFNSIPEDIYEFPTLNNVANRRMQMFLNYLNDDKPFPATFQVIKDNSPQRVVFLERLIEDRLENSLSYHEFLQHIKTQVK